VLCFSHRSLLQWGQFSTASIWQSVHTAPHTSAILFSCLREFSAY